MIKARSLAVPPLPLVVTMIVLSLSTLITFVLVWRFTRPIADLSNAARQVAEGNLASVPERGRTDEMGQRFGEFNEMTAELEKKGTRSAASTGRKARGGRTSRVGDRSRDPQPAQLHQPDARSSAIEVRYRTDEEKVRCSQTDHSSRPRLRGSTSRSPIFSIIRVRQKPICGPSTRRWSRIRSASSRPRPSENNIRIASSNTKTSRRSWPIPNFCVRFSTTCSSTPCKRWARRRQPQREDLAG